MKDLGNRIEYDLNERVRGQVSNFGLLTEKCSPRGRDVGTILDVENASPWVPEQWLLISWDSGIRTWTPASEITIA